jgi:hypothetical protein
VFTKAQLRAAFPNVEQVDRRMRDLRDEGWVLVTYREDRSLAPDELRLKAEGGRVWESGYRSQGASALSAKERQAVFAADNYMCIDCGVLGGESYPDDAMRTAKLGVARRNGSEEDRTLVTLCDRCHSATASAARPADIKRAFDALSPDQRLRVQQWMREGRRRPSPEELVWSSYRRLAHEERLAFQVDLLSSSSERKP